MNEYRCFDCKKFVREDEMTVSAWGADVCAACADYEEQQHGYNIDWREEELYHEEYLPMVEESMVQLAFAGLRKSKNRRWDAGQDSRGARG